MPLGSPVLSAVLSASIFTGGTLEYFLGSRRPMTKGTPSEAEICGPFANRCAPAASARGHEAEGKPTTEQADRVRTLALRTEDKDAPRGCAQRGRH